MSRYSRRRPVRRPRRQLGRHQEMAHLHRMEFILERMWMAVDRMEATLRDQLAKTLRSRSHGR